MTVVSSLRMFLVLAEALGTMFCILETRCPPFRRRRCEVANLAGECPLAHSFFPYEMVRNSWTSHVLVQQVSAASKVRSPFRCPHCILHLPSRGFGHEVTLTGVDGIGTREAGKRHCHRPTPSSFFRPKSTSS